MQHFNFEDWRIEELVNSIFDVRNRLYDLDPTQTNWTRPKQLVLDQNPKLF